jgi:hypothetical protein
VIEKSQVVIVLFYHASQQDLALSLQAAIGDEVRSEIPVNVILADHTARVTGDVLDRMQVLVVLYTPDLERSENLYHIIQSIERNPRLERFFVFPQVGANGAIPFPPLFHTIRAQQHHIFGYPENSNNLVDTVSFQGRFLKELGESISKISVQDRTDRVQTHPGLRTRLKKAWNSPRRSMIMVSAVLFLGLVLLALFLAPKFLASLQSLLDPLKQNISPPAFQTSWLDETFTAIEPEIWHESNLFMGSNPLSVDLKNGKLVLHAGSETKHAIYRLESISEWSLDDLEGFQASFLLEPFQAEDSQASITYQIQLVDQPGYSFGCHAIPAATQATLQCEIQLPERKIAIRSRESLSLNEWHTLSLEFIPHTYVVRFFLDDSYFGQAAIPEVENWRSRGFIAGIQVEIENMRDGFFAFQLDSYKLARQEKAVIHE